MEEILREELRRRLEKMQHILKETNADACIVTSPVNQYYFCHSIFDGYLYIFPESEPVWFVKRPVGIGGENVIYIRKPEQICNFLDRLPKRLLIENDVLPYNSSVWLQAALGIPEIINASTKIREIRAVKSEYELEQMRQSAEIHTRVYEEIPILYRKGMTDIELQIEIERQMRLMGSLGIFRSFGENMDIFMGSMLAGDNAQVASPFDFALGGEGISPLLPLGANGTKLTSGTTLMVDMAGNFRPYMDDMTRTFVIERAPDIAYKAHEASIEIHRAICETAKVGTPCFELYLMAEQMTKENGLHPYFMGTVQQAKFIGHGVGLEINEPPVLTPRSKEVLQAGMAIAIEPKFVLPGIGAVGIENTYVVRENGLEKITVCEEGLIVL